MYTKFYHAPLVLKTPSILTCRSYQATLRPPYKGPTGIEDNLGCRKDLGQAYDHYTGKATTA